MLKDVDQDMRVKPYQNNPALQVFMEVAGLLDNPAGATLKEPSVAKLLFDTAAMVQAKLAFGDDGQEPSKASLERRDASEILVNLIHKTLPCESTHKKVCSKPIPIEGADKVTAVVERVMAATKEFQDKVATSRVESKFQSTVGRVQALREIYDAHEGVAAWVKVKEDPEFTVDTLVAKCTESVFLIPDEDWETELCKVGEDRRRTLILSA